MRSILFRMKRIETFVLSGVYFLMIAILVFKILPDNLEFFDYIYDSDAYHNAVFTPTVYGLECAIQMVLNIGALFYGAWEMNADRRRGIIAQLLCIESEGRLIANRLCSLLVLIAGFDILGILLGLLANVYTGKLAPEYKVIPSISSKCILDYAGLFLSFALIIMTYYLVGIIIGIIVSNRVVVLLLGIGALMVLDRLDYLNGISSLFASKSVFLMTSLDSFTLPKASKAILWICGIAAFAILYGIAVLVMKEKKNGYET